MDERTHEELLSTGLIDETQQDHLTIKGRAWLRSLNELQDREVEREVDAAADLVLSTSAVLR